MAFHNVPPNGFPDLPDVEELEVVVKDVADLKTGFSGLSEDIGNLGGSIAPEFSTESAYAAGDLVYHSGALYEFTANHAAGAWSTSDTQAVTVGGKIESLEGNVASLSSAKANKNNIAPEFSEEVEYSAGDLVFYIGSVYRCTNSHEGEWDADDFAATTIDGELASLRSGLITPSAKYLLLGSGAIDGSNPVTVSLGDNNINDYDFIWIGTAYYNTGVATYGCALVPTIFIRMLYSGDAGIGIVSRDNTNTGVTPINAVYDSTNNNIRFSPEGTPAGQYYYVNGIKIRTAS